MSKIDIDKVALYQKLSEDLAEVEDSHKALRDIIKANHKYIQEVKGDVIRWKETCFRQSNRIHKLYLISMLQFLLSFGLIIWILLLSIL